MGTAIVSGMLSAREVHELSCEHFGSLLSLSVLGKNFFTELVHRSRAGHG
jgi:hypothetical protein